METALAQISTLPETVKQKDSFFYNAKKEILSGSIDVLKTKVRLTYIRDLAKELLEDKEIDEAFLAERLKYGKGEKVTVSGNELVIQETGVKYLYEDSGDQVYNDLIKEQERIKQRIKEREAYLRTLPEEGSVCPVNGNFLTRPPKTSTTKVIVKTH